MALHNTAASPPYLCNGTTPHLTHLTPPHTTPYTISFMQALIQSRSPYGEGHAWRALQQVLSHAYEDSYSYSYSKEGDADADADAGADANADAGASGGEGEGGYRGDSEAATARNSCYHRDGLAHGGDEDERAHHGQRGRAGGCAGMGENSPLNTRTSSSSGSGGTAHGGACGYDGYGSIIDGTTGEGYDHDDDDDDDGGSGSGGGGGGTDEDSTSHGGEFEEGKGEEEEEEEEDHQDQDQASASSPYVVLMLLLLQGWVSFVQVCRIRLYR